jgi:hypothetical protein
VVDAEYTTSSEHSMARRIKSMKNLSDPIGNGPCDLPACSTTPQSPVPPHTPIADLVNGIYMHNIVTRIGIKLDTLQFEYVLQLMKCKQYIYLDCVLVLVLKRLTCRYCFVFYVLNEECDGEFLSWSKSVCMVFFVFV